MADHFLKGSNYWLSGNYELTLWLLILFSQLSLSFISHGKKSNIKVLYNNLQGFSSTLQCNTLKYISLFLCIFQACANPVNAFDKAFNKEGKLLEYLGAYVEIFKENIELKI